MTMKDFQTAKSIIRKIKTILKIKIINRTKHKMTTKVMEAQTKPSLRDVLNMVTINISQKRNLS